MRTRLVAAVVYVIAVVKVSATSPHFFILCAKYLVRALDSITIVVLVALCQTNFLKCLVNAFFVTRHAQEWVL